MIYDNWKEEYHNLFQLLREKMGNELSQKEVTFELIQYRFTSVAKELILQRFPKTKLDMEEQTRTLKWGRFGRFKYVYHKEQAEDIKNYLKSLILESFPHADIRYFT
jgi:spore photoproduct lyase